MARIPEHLGTLRLVRQLGLGRQCQVWEAVDEATRRKVAIKVLVPEMAGDAQQIRLLRQELLVGKGLDHPNLIRIESLSRAGGLPHLVMELFPHPNLKRQLNADLEALASRVDRIARGLAAGLEHMHARGWVHRDVKPENILADPDGGVKLLDYAIAARKAGMLGRLFGGRAAQGSPSYIAPEQIRGRAADPRSDLYSFGCVLFELLAGRPPYTAANYNELLNKHISAPLPAVEAVNPKATKAVSKLIRHLLAKQVADRPASMTEVVQQLRGMTLLQ